MFGLSMVPSIRKLNFECTKFLLVHYKNLVENVIQSVVLLTFNSLVIGHPNEQSVVLKLNGLKFHIESRKLDILSLSETWLSNKNSSNHLLITD